MSLPYPSMTFVPLDVLTADEMNQLVANIESLADGSGLDAGAIGTSAIANAAITSQKIDWTTINFSDSIEQPVGIDVNGDVIWRKLVDFGALPNATTKLVPSGVVNMKQLYSLLAVAKISGGGTYLGLPYCHPNQQSLNINIAYTDNSVQILTGTDRSNYSAIAILEYTKSQA